MSERVRSMKPISRPARHAEERRALAKRIAELDKLEKSKAILPLADVSLDAIDMLTIVIIGNSQSRAITDTGRVWAYTPRGYAAKVPERRGARRA